MKEICLKEAHTISWQKRGRCQFSSHAYKRPTLLYEAWKFHSNFLKSRQLNSIHLQQKREAGVFSSIFLCPGVWPTGLCTSVVGDQVIGGIVRLGVTQALWSCFYWKLGIYGSWMKQKETEGNKSNLYKLVLHSFHNLNI